MLLNFWASWCGPCRDELPQVEKIHREFRSKGLAVLAINLAEPLEKVRRFVSQNGYTFTVLLDSRLEGGRLYAAQYIPTTLLIDPAGNATV